MKDNSAFLAAAKAVRQELVRLDYVEGSLEPDEEDLAIATAAINAYWVIVEPRIQDQLDRLKNLLNVLENQIEENTL